MQDQIETIINDLIKYLLEIIHRSDVDTSVEVNKETGETCKLNGTFEIIDLKKIARTMERIKNLREWVSKE